VEEEDFNQNCKFVTVLKGLRDFYIIALYFLIYIVDSVWSINCPQTCLHCMYCSVIYRLVGIFRMFLQELVEVGNVKICDSLLDTNNVVMKVGVYIPVYP
jgi:hypothetical protein